MGDVSFDPPSKSLGTPALGPFSDKEMEEWFVAGYFTTKLLLREGTAGDFTMLGTLIKKFGKFPFISNNEAMTPSTAFDKLLPLSFANFEEESTSAFGFRSSSLLNVQPPSALTTELRIPAAGTFSNLSSSLGFSGASPLSSLSRAAPFALSLDVPLFNGREYLGGIQSMLTPDDRSSGSTKSLSQFGVDTSESLVLRDLTSQNSERSFLTKIEDDLKEKLMKQMKESLDLKYEQLKIAEERLVIEEHQRLLEDEKKRREERWKMEEQRRRLEEERRRIEELHRRTTEEQRRQEQLRLERQRVEAEKERTQRERMSLEEERVRLMELHRKMEEEHRRLMESPHTAEKDEKHPTTLNESFTSEEEKVKDFKRDENEHKWETEADAYQVNSNNRLLDDIDLLLDCNSEVLAGDEPCPCGNNSYEQDDLDGGSLKEVVKSDQEKVLEQSADGGRNKTVREIKLVPWKNLVKDGFEQKPFDKDKCPWMSTTKAKDQSGAFDEEPTWTAAADEEWEVLEEEGKRNCPSSWTTQRSVEDVSKKIPSFMEIQQEQEKQERLEKQERAKHLEMEKQLQCKKQLAKTVATNPWLHPQSSCPPPPPPPPINVTAKTPCPPSVSAVLRTSVGVCGATNYSIPSLLSLPLQRPQSVTPMTQSPFQKYASRKSELLFWCRNNLLLSGSPAVDVSTLIDFLFDVENPYELHSYVRQHLGQSLQANEFARRIIEWKGQLKANGISNAPVQNSFQGFPRYGMVPQTAHLFGPRPYVVHPPTEAQMKSGKKKDEKIS